jgi:hypothetical protein
MGKRRSMRKKRRNNNFGGPVDECECVDDCTCNNCSGDSCPLNTGSSQQQWYPPPQPPPYSPPFLPQQSFSPSFSPQQSFSQQYQPFSDRYSEGTNRYGQPVLQQPHSNTIVQSPAAQASNPMIFLPGQGQGQGNQDQSIVLIGKLMDQMGKMFMPDPAPASVPVVSGPSAEEEMKHIDKIEEIHKEIEELKKKIETSPDVSAKIEALEQNRQKLIDTLNERIVALEERIKSIPADNTATIDNIQKQLDVLKACCDKHKVSLDQTKSVDSPVAPRESLRIMEKNRGIPLSPNIPYRTDLSKESVSVAPITSTNPIITEILKDNEPIYIPCDIEYYRKLLGYNVWNALVNPPVSKSFFLHSTPNPNIVKFKEYLDDLKNRLGTNIKTEIDDKVLSDLNKALEKVESSKDLHEKVESSKDFKLKLYDHTKNTNCFIGSNLDIIIDAITKYISYVIVDGNKWESTTMTAKNGYNTTTEYNDLMKESTKAKIPEFGHKQKKSVKKLRKKRVVSKRKNKKC